MVSHMIADPIVEQFLEFFHVDRSFRLYYSKFIIS